MIPVTQFILGNSDPLLYPSEKMTNSKVWEYFHMNN